jgi:hypothetical protein
MSDFSRQGTYPFATLSGRVKGLWLSNEWAQVPIA